MARFVTGNTFGTTDTVTATKLNNAVNNAAISTDSVDNNTIEVNSNALRLKDSSSKTTGVTFAKMQHISTAQVLGRVSASEGDVEEVGVVIGGSGDAGLLFDNDDMLDNSDTAGGSATRGATQQSIKAYVDSTGIVQTALASTTTGATTTSSIPLDNTVPQIDEGGSTGLSVSMTPTSTTNTIRATIEGRFRCDTSDATIVVALFEGNTCVGVSEYRQPSGGIGSTNSTYYFNAASTAAHTYTVRFGTSAGNAVMDLDPAFGGVRKATLFLEEISV